MSGAVRAAGLRCYALSRRALSTSTDPSLNPLPHELSPISSTDAGRKRKGEGVHRRMIFVRPWDGIPTMAHAFAIVRDIERRFGRIQDFVIVRDSDVHSSFSPFLHATFSREEDADAIPLDGKVIQVVMPEIDREREGGIGLDDLHVYLNPETREQALLNRESAPEKEPEWGPPEGKVMDVKLERTGLREPPAVLDQAFGFGRRGPPHLNNPIRTRELAHAICAFGGFVDHPQGSQTPMGTIVSRWSGKVKQPPQPRPDPTQENVVEEDLIENPEEPALLENFQWRPFEIKSEAPSPIPSAPSTLNFTPTPSPPVSPPFTSPSTTSSQPKHNLEPVNDKHTPKPDSKPKPEPEPNVTLVEPKMSKKQRMLNAARLAGAMAAEKQSGTSVEPRPQAISPILGVENINTELDPKTSEEENKVAARRWWKFLTGVN